MHEPPFHWSDLNLSPKIQKKIISVFAFHIFLEYTMCSRLFPRRWNTYLQWNYSYVDYIVFWHWDKIPWREPPDGSTRSVDADWISKQTNKIMFGICVWSFGRYTHLSPFHRHSSQRTDHKFWTIWRVCQKNYSRNFRTSWTANKSWET